MRATEPKYRVHRRISSRRTSRRHPKGEELVQARPGNGPGRLPLREFPDRLPGTGVEGRVASMGVDQDVGIDRDHDLRLSSRTAPGTTPDLPAEAEKQAPGCSPGGASNVCGPGSHPRPDRWWPDSSRGLESPPLRAGDRAPGVPRSVDVAPGGTPGSGVR